MRLPPLIQGRILRRYKRFLADIKLEDGRVVVAHCPNTGTMATCWEPGAPAQISHSDNPRRKLEWTLERIDMGHGWVGVNTHRTNAVVEEGVRQGRIPALEGYASLRREATYDLPGQPRSRIDLLLSDDSWGEAVVEVKNATLLDGDCIRFPDAVTVRGRKHLDALAEIRNAGRRAVMLFAVNRPEGRMFAPAWSLDPGYSSRLVEVAAEGVEVLAVRIAHTDDAMFVNGAVEIDLDGSDS